LDRFSATELVRVVDEHGISVINSVPTALGDLLSLHRQESIPPMEAVRHVFQSGESLPVSTLSDIMALFPNARFGSAYGSTEAGLVTYLDHEDHLSRPRSCGRPLPGVDVCIRKDDGTVASIGEAGEILVRASEPGTYTVAAGYLDPGEPFADADHWFHTGDMATIDEDGFYRIVDRKKDMILSGGTNISSKEVEEVIGSHPGVREVVVTGEPDERFGERVVAWIVEQPGVRLSADQVRLHVAEHADPYKRPSVICFVDSLPRSATGKLTKRVLREDDTYRRNARIA
jgi:long-chain acyl-CoA synthetase